MRARHCDVVADEALQRRRLVEREQVTLHRADEIAFAQRAVAGLELSHGSGVGTGPEGGGS